MADGVTMAPIDAGRQTPDHEQVSRLLWLRQRGEVFRFILDPTADPVLLLEKIGAPGGTVLARAADAQAAGRAADSGLVLVDGEDGLAFCTPSPPAEFLPRLARTAAAGVASLPALALLADSGAGPLAVDPADDAAARSYVPDGEHVVYDPQLWDDLLRPDVATIAFALAAAVPGERMWFWLAEEAGDGALPLIVQPVAWDPNHDRTNWLIDRNDEAGAGDGQSGTATITDDGTMQFLGIGLTLPMLEGLALWVAAHAADHPALGRLVDCELLASSGAVVEEVIAEPALWQGVARAEVPGTVRATSAVLERLPVGGECWFWLTGSGGNPPFLHIVPVADDPEGAAFQADLPRLYRRFANSFQDAITGVASQPEAGQLVFSSLDTQVEGFSDQIRALLDRYGVSFPALHALESATLLRGEPRVVATAAQT